LSTYRREAVISLYQAIAGEGTLSSCVNQFGLAVSQKSNSFVASIIQPEIVAGAFV
jgi:hypothetical protein